LTIARKAAAAASVGFLLEEVAPLEFATGPRTERYRSRAILSVYRLAVIS
jgi:hypothetical protein